VALRVVREKQIKEYCACPKGGADRQKKQAPKAAEKHLKKGKRKRGVRSELGSKKKGEPENAQLAYNALHLEKRVQPRKGKNSEFERNATKHTLRGLWGGGKKKSKEVVRCRKKLGWLNELK